MADDFSTALRRDLLNLAGRALSERVVSAEDTHLFLLDRNGGFAYLDRNLAELFGLSYPVTPGVRFDESSLVPTTPVASAIMSGQAGDVPEPCFAVVKGQIESDFVWQFEVFPVASPRMQGGGGVLCLLSKSQTPPTGAPADSVLYASALNERLARERVETTQAVAVTMRHEINNALTSLLGNAELLLRRAGELDEGAIDRIQEIVRQGRRIQTVLDRLEALTEIRTTTYYGGVQMIDLDGQSDNTGRHDDE